MIIQCESCARKYIVKDDDIPNDGRAVKCGYCSVTWYQMPTSKKVHTIQKQKITKPPAAKNQLVKLHRIILKHQIY